MNLRLFGSFSLTKVVRWGPVVAVALSIQARAVADSVTEWNERALACTVAAKQLPYAATRAMAMVHVAMFDAANSVEHRYTAYRVQASARPGSSGAAAAVAAAHSVLLKLFPDQRADVDAAYAASMARIPDDGKAGGVAVGEKVADDIISLRENDGAEAPTSTGRSQFREPT